MRTNDEARGARVGAGEDRLSAVVAGALVAANVLGGGILVALKALDVPPLVASPTDPAGPGAIAAGPDRPAPEPAVARSLPEGPHRWRR